MVAADTNIVLRFILKDHPVQSPRARDLIAHNAIFIPVTVILETEWVLRRVYKLSKSDVNNALNAIVGTETIHVDHVDTVLTALELSEQGIDFADALHLAASASCEWMATFDQDFVKFGKSSTPPVRQP
jgi:predicted nucleic-acid-binding protein